MSEPQSKLREDVGISVERMIRFCYLAQMQFGEVTPVAMSHPKGSAEDRQTRHVLMINA